MKKEKESSIRRHTLTVVQHSSVDPVHFTLSETCCPLQRIIRHAVSHLHFGLVILHRQHPVVHRSSHGIPHQVSLLRLTNSSHDIKVSNDYITSN